MALLHTLPEKRVETLCWCIIRQLVYLIHARVVQNIKVLIIVSTKRKKKALKINLMPPLSDNPVGLSIIAKYLCTFSGVHEETRIIS